MKAPMPVMMTVKPRRRGEYCERCLCDMRDTERVLCGPCRKDEPGFPYVLVRYENPFVEEYNASMELMIVEANKKSARDSAAAEERKLAFALQREKGETDRRVRMARHYRQMRIDDETRERARERARNNRLAMERRRQREIDERPDF